MKTLKFKLYDYDEALLEKQAGARRFVFNFFLALRIKTYKKTGKTLSYGEMSKLLTTLKTKKRVKLEIARYGKERKDGTRRELKPEIKYVDCTWLQEVSSIVLQQSLKDLDQAFQNFFRRIKKGETPGFPRFKSKYGNQSFRILGSGSIHIDNNHLDIPRIGLVRFRSSREWHRLLRKHTCTSYTISKDADGWYVSFLIDYDYKPLKKTKKVTALDLGTKRLYTRENGKYLKPLNTKEVTDEIENLQRILSNKEKSSKSYAKTKHLLARKQQHLRRKREDFNHKTSKNLIERFDTIIIEDLKVKKMTKNGSGKKKLNRVFLDRAVGQFVSMLEYKSELYGKSLIRVNPAYTSQTCSNCGIVKKSNRKSQSLYKCSCGLKINADKNAAINIFRLGTNLSESKGRRRITTALAK